MGPAPTQDVVAMLSPISRLRPARSANSNGRHARRITPACRGGASSLLRLTPTTALRLPSTLDLSGWVSRAASALSLPSPAAFAPSEFTAR